MDNSRLKVAILSSIISSIVVLYFIDPILSWIGKIFLEIVGYISTSYQDRLYAEISTGLPNYSFLVLVIAVCPVFAYSMGTLAGKLLRFILPRRVRTSSRSMEIREKIRSSLFYNTLLVVTSLMFLFLIIDGYIRVKTVSTFKQHIDVIEPHISEKKVKLIESDFASMRSRSDFIQIRAEINSIADSNDIDLPKNKLHPF